MGYKVTIPYKLAKPQNSDTATNTWLETDSIMKTWLINLQYRILWKMISCNSMAKAPRTSNVKATKAKAFNQIIRNLMAMDLYMDLRYRKKMRRSLKRKLVVYWLRRRTPVFFRIVKAGYARSWFLLWFWFWYWYATVLPRRTMALLSFGKAVWRSGLIVGWGRTFGCLASLEDSFLVRISTASSSSSYHILFSRVTTHST